MSEKAPNVEENTKCGSTHQLSMSEEPPTTTGLTKARKLQLFALICMVLYLTFATSRLPDVYLPLYNEEHNVTTVWTGAMMGAGWLSSFLSCLFAFYFLNNFSNRTIFICSTILVGSAIMLHSPLDFISSTPYYPWLSFALKFAQGIGLGLIDVAAFAALVVIYPRKVATVTAVGESILQGAFASGPFLGSVLYAAGGYKLAFFVPGVVILLFALPECLIPQLTSRVERASRETLSSLLDPWLLFPVWHLTMTQLVNTYHIPVLSPYVEEALGASLMWTGTALLLGTGCVCLTSPLLGYLMDRFNPYCFFLASALLLPLVYLFLGPLPLLTFVEPSKPQVMITLVLLGLIVAMGAIPTLAIMMDLYKARHGEAQSSAANLLVSMYCAAYPLGGWLGITISGAVAESISFRWSTGVVALLFFLESAACVGFCIAVYRMKRVWRENRMDYSIIAMDLERPE